MPSGSENLRGKARQTDIISSFPVVNGFPSELTLTEPESQETQINLLAAQSLGGYLRRSQDSPIPTVFWAAPNAVGLVVSWKRWEKLRKTAKRPESGINLGQNSITAAVLNGEKTTFAEAAFQITGRNNLGILFIGSGSSRGLETVLNALVKTAISLTGKYPDKSV